MLFTNCKYFEQNVSCLFIPDFPLINIHIVQVHSPISLINRVAKESSLRARVLNNTKFLFKVFHYNFRTLGAKGLFAFPPRLIENLHLSQMTWDNHWQSNITPHILIQAYSIMRAIRKAYQCMQHE